MTAWFDIDKDGLRKLMEGRNKAFVLFELIQNAWDENVTDVQVRMSRAQGSPYVMIEIEDDSPEGFADLSHAFTLFAESQKKSDPEKRGRFNLGEKLILACCEEALIESTTGAVEFGANGRRKLRRTRDEGSKFYGRMRMTREEQAEAEDMLKLLIPPKGIKTSYHGVELKRPTQSPAGVTNVTLPTVISDDEGVLRPTRRKTTIELFECEPAQGWIYEMGIPVVKTGDDWHVNVLQKVPLNMDRDNVSPAYLREIRTATMNLAHSLLTEDAANATWAKEALESPNVSAAAIESIVKHRFGDKVVSYDPSDPEANSIATSKGYTVVHGRSLSKDAWRNIRGADAILPAGQVTPSRPEPGAKIDTIHIKDWTTGMHQLAVFAKSLSREILDVEPSVTFITSPNYYAAADWAANPTRPQLRFNLSKLGRNWPENCVREDVIDLLLHEFGHQFESDHLSSRYYKALTKLGARLSIAAAQEPKLLSQHDVNLSAAIKAAKVTMKHMPGKGKQPAPGVR